MSGFRAPSETSSEGELPSTPVLQTFLPSLSPSAYLFPDGVHDHHDAAEDTEESETDTDDDSSQDSDSSSGLEFIDEWFQTRNEMEQAIQRIFNANPEIETLENYRNLRRVMDWVRSYAYTHDMDFETALRQLNDEFRARRLRREAAEEYRRNFIANLEWFGLEQEDSSSSEADDDSDDDEPLQPFFRDFADRDEGYNSRFA